MDSLRIRLQLQPHLHAVGQSPSSDANDSRTANQPTENKEGGPLNLIPFGPSILMCLLRLFMDPLLRGVEFNCGINDS